MILKKKNNRNLSNFKKNNFKKMDLQTIEKIKKEAHPKLRDELQKIYEEANKKLGKSRLHFSMILRTFKEQDDIYAQGRTKKGKIVTDAKAGQSYHNYAYRDWETDRKSTRLNSSHRSLSRMPSSA